MEKLAYFIGGCLHGVQRYLPVDQDWYSICVEYPDEYNVTVGGRPVAAITYNYAEVLPGSSVFCCTD